MAKKRSSKSSKPGGTPPPPDLNQDDSELLDELMAHIESNNTPQQTKVEAAEVVREMNQSRSPPSAEVDGKRKSNRQRFEERKVWLAIYPIFSC